MINTQFYLKKSFKTGQLRPKGWLKRQLEIQAQGLTGFLEDIWPDVGPNSGWLGGNGENWERGPYYLDGLIPLAYLLEDDTLKQKAQKWIEWTLKSQKETGFFGPETNEDWWPRMVMIKVLIQYYEATSDERIIPFMRKYFQYQNEVIEEKPLKMWGMPRAGENILGIYWLYDQTQDEFLIELAKKIWNQSFDWSRFFSVFPFKKPMSEIMPWHYVEKHLEELCGEKVDPFSQNAGELMDKIFEKHKNNPEIIDVFEKYHYSHVVNVAMAVKYPYLRYLLTGDIMDNEAQQVAIKNLMAYHGMPNGMFSGDEHLNGKSPVQGTELCAVVEYMYSLETLMKLTENKKYGETLEYVAYNALPATFTEDMKSHQYVQQVNQIKASVEVRPWYNNGSQANIYGLEPNFGCCTANMHQGWPKLVRNLWLQHIDGTLVKDVYGPSQLQFSLEDQIITIDEITDYPFRDDITFKINTKKPKAFPIQFRIPSWSEETIITYKDQVVHIGKKEKDYYRINEKWSSQDEIKIQFKREIEVKVHNKDYSYITYGPLLMALNIDGEYKKISGEEPFHDREVLPKSDWQFSLDYKRLRQSKIKRNKITSFPFNVQKPPIEIEADFFPIKDWEEKNGNACLVAGKQSIKKTMKTEKKRLVPYGCTDLRITCFP